MATVLEEREVATGVGPVVPAVWTAVDLAARFGAMPMARLRHNRAWGEATEADLLALEDRPEKSLCELIDGVLVEKVMGSRESQIAYRLILKIGAIVEAAQLGVVLLPDGMLRFPNGRVYLPDVTFIARDRLPGGELPEAAITPIVPDLCVEIVSRSNSAAEIDSKTADYFAQGVREVWLIRPGDQTLTMLTAIDKSQTFAAGDRFTAGAILPGLEFVVGELFGPTKG
jgi:Uma2 family endonuclease